MLEPDGLGGAVPECLPNRAAPRRRGGGSGRLANAVLAQLPLAVAVIDAEMRLVFWNEQAAGLFKAPPLMAAGAPALAAILAGVPALTSDQRDRILDFCLTHIAAGDRTEPESCLRISLERGRRIVIELRGIRSRQWMLVMDDGRTALRAARFATGAGAGDAWLDPLTGLANRRQFNHVLNDLVGGAAPRSRPVLLMIDLDRFKAVNDSFGYPVGDALLCLASQRLRHETRDDDLLVRLGGDKFLVLMSNGDRAETLASRAVETLSRPFLVEGHLANIGASIGIARFPELGGSADDLVRHAEVCLRDAKAAGGRSWRVFDPAMAEQAAAKGEPRDREPKAG